jgi:Zn-finger nucleic acid-binding protein
MVYDRRDDVTVDRCQKCAGLWCDRTELDALVRRYLPAGAGLPEARVPQRGLSVRECPRCRVRLHTAGWDDVVLDRCPDCLGLFVEWGEWRHLTQREMPADAYAFEHRFRDAMVQAGWALYYANGILYLILRLLRR